MNKYSLSFFAFQTDFYLYNQLLNINNYEILIKFKQNLNNKYASVCSWAESLQNHRWWSCSIFFLVPVLERKKTETGGEARRTPWDRKLKWCNGFDMKSIWLLDHNERVGISIPLHTLYNFEIRHESLEL